MPVRVLVFVACVVACAAAHLAILVSIARRPAASADAATALNVPRPRRGPEILWALLPSLALALVLTATWSRIRQQPAEHHPPAVMKVAR
jgi:H+/Cl- antiporter ClcA